MVRDICSNSKYELMILSKTKHEDKKKPYLSIVLSFRNDRYQGNSLRRFHIALDCLIYQAKRYNLDLELIIVEWNPPSDRPFLKDALSWPTDLGPVTVRIITVPNEVHKRYKYFKKMNIICAPAVNVGIRRANGKFVLSTASGILFSNELIEFLSSEELNEDSFYRINRCDVDRKILKCSSIEQQIDFCKKNIIRVNTPLSADRDLKNYPNLYTNASGDFILLSRKFWHLLHGFPEFNELGLHTDGLLCYMTYLAGAKQRILQEPMRLYHIDHDSRQAKFTKPNTRLKIFLKSRIYDRMRDDNPLKVLAKQFVRIPRSIVFLSLQNLFPHIYEFNSDYLYWKYKKILKNMLLNKRSYIFNGSDWGLPKENFEEFILSSNEKFKKYYGQKQNK